MCIRDSIEGHEIIEQVIVDSKDGPLATYPPGPTPPTSTGSPPPSFRSTSPAPPPSPPAWPPPSAVDPCDTPDRHVGGTHAKAWEWGTPCVRRVDRSRLTAGLASDLLAATVYVAATLVLRDSESGRATCPPRVNATIPR